MADTGVKYPATVSTIQETGDDNDWTTPGNVGADDAAYASITAASFDANDLSYLLRATNPSMGVPAGATINGILVEIERHYANGTVADYDVCLTKDGTTRVGDDKSTGAAFPATDAITSFGGATDLWGTTWTVDEINATTFGVLYKMQATGANADGFVDFIRITVYYTGAVTHYGVATLSGIGTLAGIGALILTGLTTLAGTGALAAIGQRIVTGLATLAGIGSVVCIGTVGGIIQYGAAILSGIGTVIGKAAIIFAGKATIAGIGSLAVIGRGIFIGATTLSGAGNLTTIGQRIVNGVAVLTGSGLLVTKGVGTFIGKAALAGVGTLAAILSKLPMYGKAALSGIGAMSAIAKKKLVAPPGREVKSYEPAVPGELWY